MAGAQRRLTDLGLTARGGLDPALSGIAVDSRAVGPGFLFAALPGSRMHGAAHVAMALERGAVAVLTDAEGAQPVIQSARHANTPSGEVAEWSNAPDSKSGVRFYRTVGSNPTLSAKQSFFKSSIFQTRPRSC